MYMCKSMALNAEIAETVFSLIISLLSRKLEQPILFPWLDIDGMAMDIDDGLLLLLPPVLLLLAQLLQPPLVALGLHLHLVETRNGLELL